MTDKTTNYTAAQEALIVKIIAENDGVANKALAERLAAMSEMDAPADSVKPGPRNARSLVAKMRRVVDANPGFTYERVATKTKTGGVPTNKLTLVKEIVTMAGVTAASLDGLEKSPKLALETMRDIVRALTSEAA